MADSAQLSKLAGDLTSAVSEYGDRSGDAGLVARKRIIGLAKEIIREVKEPGETPFEYSSYMAELGAVRILMELKVFDTIPDDGPISYKELAEKVNCQEVLLRRFCWMLVVTGMLVQPDEDHIAHSRFSKTYANKNPQGIFFQILFDEALVPYTRWPDFFKTYGYKEPEGDIHTPHGFGWGHPDLNFWQIMAKYPQRQTDFNTSMATLDAFLPVRGMFPFAWIQEHMGDVAPDAPLVVDVGGGKGQALKQILAEVPDLPADRLVLEDRPEVIAEVESLAEPELKGVKKIPHDFFKEQPAKGALVYYIRRVMHDWSDADNTTILRHLADAMTPQSRVLITEQIYASPPTEMAAWTDLCMLGLGGKERTKRNWEQLVPAAGLKLVKFWELAGTEVAVIECEKA